ncbi:MAG: FAD-dependent monooxygenase [Rhizobiales bacterium]|nr:FAD-dependent monooxygenase [Hyphomicrobiales bacterium]
MTAAAILVAGGGPAGLAAAALLALDGARVTLVTGGAPATPDPRTVAIMQPQMRLLAHLGIWTPDLRVQVAPLKRLRLVDDTGALLRAPTVTFDADEIAESEFGWNLPLALLVPALAARARDLGVTIIEADVTAAKCSDSEIEVETTAGRFSAALAIAADGRKSVLREAAAIRCDSWNYDQVAIATSFDHSAAHLGISTEYHRGSGPCTTVPLSGNRSSLVWMERPARVDELMALPDAALAAEIQLAIHGDLGRVSGIGPRRAFAMQGLIAQQFARNRTLLVGEAGHVVPPIGAQGLNMSLRDAADAAELVAGVPDPGAAEVLAAYDRHRRRDVGPRQQMIDLMNRSLLSGLMPLEVGRAIALEMISRFGPLRRFVMRQGLGPQTLLPRAMREADSSPAPVA